MHALNRRSLVDAQRWICAGLMLWFVGTAESAIAANADYTPTMKDMMSIQTTLEHYHQGAEKHDNKIMASAFAEEATFALIERGVELKKVTGRSNIAAGGLMGGAPPTGSAPPAGIQGAPPAGSAPPPAGIQGVSPPGSAPPGGAGAPPAGGPPAGVSAPAAPMGEIWHFSTNDYFKFESPTRATHTSYWLDLRPGEGRQSTVGIPGHYEDIFVKRHGEWLLLERKICVGMK